MLACRSWKTRPRVKENARLKWLERRSRVCMLAFIWIGWWNLGDTFLGILCVMHTAIWDRHTLGCSYVPYVLTGHRNSCWWWSATCTSDHQYQGRDQELGCFRIEAKCFAQQLAKEVFRKRHIGQHRRLQSEPFFKRLAGHRVTHRRCEELFQLLRSKSHCYARRVYDLPLRDRFSFRNLLWPRLHEEQNHVGQEDGSRAGPFGQIFEEPTRHYKQQWYVRGRHPIWK